MKISIMAFDIYFKKFCAVVIFFLLSTGTHSLSAQKAIPVGTWRAHIPYRYCISMNHVGNTLYLATERGLIIEDKTSGSRQYLSYFDGLGGAIISYADYCHATQSLVIGYSNGNIDVLKNNEIITFTDIARYETVGGKNINNIYCYGKHAYISCDFGVVVLDTDKEEVSESWLNLRRNSVEMGINQAAVFKDTMYLVGNQGAIFCPMSNAFNKADRNSWKAYSLPLGGIPVKMHVSENSLNLYLTSGKVFRKFRDTAYSYSESIIGPGENVYGMYEHSGELYMAVKDALLKLTDTSADTVLKDLPSPRSVYIDEENTFWVADYYSALVKVKNGNREVIWPPGPTDNSMFSLGNVQGKTTLFAGGYASNYVHFSRYTNLNMFVNNVWVTSSVNVLSQDNVASVHNSVTGKSYIASYGQGVTEVSANGQTRALTDADPDVPFVSQFGGGWHRATSLFVEPSGKTWMGIHAKENRISPSLYALNTNGTWESYVMGSEENLQYPYRLVVDVYGNKWVSTRYTQNRNGLYVYNEKATGAKYRRLFDREGEGNLRDVVVGALAVDKNNDIWIGTARGISVMPSSTNALTAANYDAFWPVVNGRPLLENEFINDIEVDGGNRKWVATGNGLWLLSPDGKEVIHNFTAANSPLPSNNVTDVYIDAVSSEVFILTDLGLLSFRGSATGAVKGFGAVKVFPNPAQCCSAPVSITGLTDDAVFKITDVAGRLIFEGKANGGMAVWYMKSFAGERPAPGVYLVFAASEDGEEALVSKFAITE